MPGDYSLFPVDQDRVRKAELPDRGGDLCGLFWGMSPRVPRIRDQRADRAHDDLVGQVHRCASKITRFSKKNGSRGRARLFIR
jgi:hypothetical protein